MNLIYALIFLLVCPPVGRVQTNTKDANDIDHVTFGIYCGECSRHCATMYQYNMMGNANTLLMDTADSYFKNNRNVICKTSLTDRIKFILAAGIVAKIPSAFLTTRDSVEVFGCPDCTDGCGIYFELSNSHQVKKFYIDTDIDKLAEPVKAFAVFLKTQIDSLNKSFYR